MTVIPFVPTYLQAPMLIVMVVCAAATILTFVNLPESYGFKNMSSRKQLATAILFMTGLMWTLFVWAAISASSPIADQFEKIVLGLSMLSNIISFFVNVKILRRKPKEVRHDS